MLESVISKAVFVITSAFQTDATSLKRDMKVIPLVVLLLMSTVSAGSIYSYVDENGVRVWTNVGTDRVTPKAPGSSSRSVQSANFYPLIRETASKYGVDEGLVQAIIKVESNYDPSAVSVKDCKGLMQLHPDTAQRFGVSNVFDPAENIEGGVRYLSYLIQNFDDLDLVLAAYNAGENAVKRYDGIPPYSETEDYIEKVRAIVGDELDSEKEEPKPVRRNRRVFRTVDEDGNVLFTNLP